MQSRPISATTTSMPLLALPQSNGSLDTLLQKTRPLPLQSPDYWRTRQIQMGFGVGLAVAGATIAYLTATAQQPLPPKDTPHSEDILLLPETSVCEAPPPKFTPIQIAAPSASLTEDYLVPFFEAFTAAMVAAPVFYLLSRSRTPSAIAQPIKPPSTVLLEPVIELKREVTEKILETLVDDEQEFIPFTEEAACFLNRGFPLEPGHRLLIRHDTLPAFKDALKFVIENKACPVMRLHFYLETPQETIPIEIHLKEHERWLVRGILDQADAGSSCNAASEIASSAFTQCENSVSRQGSLHATSAEESYLASLFKQFLRKQRQRDQGKNQTALALARRKQRSAENETDDSVMLAKTVRCHASVSLSIANLSNTRNFYSKYDLSSHIEHCLASNQPKALTYQGASAPEETQYESVSGVSHSQLVPNHLWNSLIACEQREERPPPKVETWNEWFSAWVDTAYDLCKATWVATKGWMNLLVDASWHYQHPAHHQKYYLALETQEKGFHRFLEKHIRFKNTSDEFLKNLNAKIKGEKLEKPYDEFFEADTPELYSHLYASLTALLNKKNYENIRHRNYEYLFNLRNALGSKEYKKGLNQDLNTLLRQLCFCKFHENDMTHYEEAFLEEAITTSLAEKEAAAFSKFFDAFRQGKICLNKENIAEMIRKANDCLTLAQHNLRKAPQDLAIQKLENELGVFSDPLGTSNIPEIRSIHKVQRAGKEYEIVYLRHGSATYELGISNFIRRIFKLGNAVPTVPEYGGFLDAMQEENLNVLYVNHQNMSKTGTAEANRAEAIAGLEDKYPNFHFLSLPMDLSALAPILDGKRTNERVESLLSKHKKHPLWIYSLLDALVQEEAGFLLPQSLIRVVGRREKILRDCLVIAGNVKRLFFNEDELKDRSARLIFLMIFYSYIKEYIKGKLDIQAIASVCKDAKDRANAAAAVDEALHNLRLGREDDPQALYDLFIKTLSPFIIKYEQIISERLELLLNVLEKIASLSPAQKKEIRNYRVLDNFTLIDQRVPRSGPRCYEPIEWSKTKIQDQESLLKTLRQTIDQDYELHGFLAELIHGYYDPKKEAFKPRYWDPINKMPVNLNTLQTKFEQLLTNKEARLVIKVNDAILDSWKTPDKDFLVRNMKQYKTQENLSFVSCLQLHAAEKSRQWLEKRLRKDDGDWAVHLLQGEKAPIRIQGELKEIINGKSKWTVTIEQDVALSNRSLHIEEVPLILKTTINPMGTTMNLQLQEPVSTLSSSSSGCSRG